jgi:hypothetical protein
MPIIGPNPTYCQYKTCTFNFYFGNNINSLLEFNILSIWLAIN